MPAVLTLGETPEVGQRESAVGTEDESRIVGNLPHVAVWISEESGIAAVEGLARGLGHLPAGTSGGAHDPIYLLTGTDVVREDNAAEGAGSVVVDSGIGSDLFTPPQHDRLPARLEEDCLLHLLTAPAKLLVEGTR